MKSTKRSQRRHQYARLRNKRKHYWNNWDKELPNPRMLGLILHTPTMCSCLTCGNPRKWWKSKTLKEKLYTQILKDELINFG